MERSVDKFGLLDDDIDNRKFGSFQNLFSRIFVFDQNKIKVNLNSNLYQKMKIVIVKIYIL